jgi:hypothetical protein
MEPVRSRGYLERAAVLTREKQRQQEQLRGSKSSLSVHYVCSFVLVGVVIGVTLVVWFVWWLTYDEEDTYGSGSRGEL